MERRIEKYAQIRKKNFDKLILKTLDDSKTV